MAQLSDKQRLKAANLTLDDSRVRDQMASIDKQICVKLPDTIITRRQKQAIRSAVDVDAAGLIHVAIQSSMLPQKLDIFLEKLDDEQPVQAQEIRKVYNEFIFKFSDGQVHKAEGVTKERPCEKCKSKAGKSTLSDSKFITVLGQLGHDFVSHLEYSIISQDTRQRIFKAQSSSEALHLTREGLERCIDPHMMDKLLELLESKKELGAELHAVNIRKIYQKYLDDCSSACANC